MKKYYNDYTVDAVEIIDSEDKEWHRLEKQYGSSDSVDLCDSQVQGYYGVNSYIGGTEADLGIIDAYRVLELTRGADNYHWLMGTGGNVYAASLLGVKYYLSKTGVVDRYGLHLVSKVGDVFIYKNELALPMVYTYERVADIDVFKELSVYDRGRNILNTCVVDMSNDNSKSDELSQNMLTDLSDYLKTIETDNRNYNVNIDENQILIIRMEMLGKGYNQNIFFTTNDGKTGTEVISYEIGEKILEISCQNLESIYFSDRVYNDMESIQFYVVDAEQYYADLLKDVEELRNHAMTITGHDDVYNYIEGSISCEQPRVLATSIPISDDWKIIVDGKEEEVITVNTAFVGCYLDEGVHDIIIYYDGKNWIETNFFKLIGFIITFGILIIGIHKEHKSKNEMNVVQL